MLIFFLNIENAATIENVIKIVRLLFFKQFKRYSTYNQNPIFHDYEYFLILKIKQML